MERNESPSFTLGDVKEGDVNGTKHSKQRLHHLYSNFVMYVIIATNGTDDVSKN